MAGTLIETAGSAGRLRLCHRFVKLIILVSHLSAAKTTLAMNYSPWKLMLAGSEATSIGRLPCFVIGTSSLFCSGTATPSHSIVFVVSLSMTKATLTMNYLLDIQLQLALTGSDAESMATINYKSTSLWSARSFAQIGAFQRHRHPKFQSLPYSSPIYQASTNPTFASTLSLSPRSIAIKLRRHLFNLYVDSLLSPLSTH